MLFFACQFSFNFVLVCKDCLKLKGYFRRGLACTMFRLQVLCYLHILIKLGLFSLWDLLLPANLCLFPLRCFLYWFLFHNITFESCPIWQLAILALLQCLQLSFLLFRWPCLPEPSELSIILIIRTGSFCTFTLK